MGKAGREALAVILPKLKSKHKPDFVILNGENLAHGLGVTKKVFEEVMALGVDAVTSGNHIFAKREAVILLEDKKNNLLRPLNYPAGVPGRGFCVLSSASQRLLLANLSGRVFMQEDLDDPFAKMEQLLEDYGLGEEAAKEGKEKVDGIVIDWHAEATSEKKALGWILDGQVSAVLGTHTHIQTNDERILPKGTAYISDVGMVGAEDSILGAEINSITPRFLKQLPSKMEPAYGGPVEVNGVVLQIKKSSGLAKNIAKIKEKVLEY